MGRKITNTAWCWTPRCEECEVCTGRRIFTATLAGVRNQDCGDCLDWNGAFKWQTTQDPAVACKWDGPTDVPCNGRIQLVIGPTPGPTDVRLEFEVYETIDGVEQLIGNWVTVLAGVNEIDCDAIGQIGVAFIPSAYQIDNGYKRCNWDGASVQIHLGDCVNEET